MSIKLFILFINLVLVNKLYKLGMILLVIMVGWMKLNKVVFVLIFVVYVFWIVIFKIYLIKINFIYC